LSCLSRAASVMSMFKLSDLYLVTACCSAESDFTPPTAQMHKHQTSNVPIFDATDSSVDNTDSA
jgi:hypothetical protein